LQHVSTQESHRQADCLRTFNTYTLYSIIHVTFALGIPYALQCVSKKPWFIIYLLVDKNRLCAAVGVVISAVVRPTRTSQPGRGVFLFSVYSSAFLLVLGLLSSGAVLYCFLWFSRGCARILPVGGGSGWALVLFVVYPPSCRVGWFHAILLYIEDEWHFPQTCTDLTIANNKRQDTIITSKASLKKSSSIDIKGNVISLQARCGPEGG